MTVPFRSLTGGGYTSSVAELGVGLVPLLDSAFNRAKSWLKGLEYAALGVPFVASPTPEYVKLAGLGAGLLADDPFQVLDAKGVGKLVKWAVRDGRETKPGLKVGICGEHGGEPRSVTFCHDAGLDYVSCSPYRVPVARLAAAHAALASAKSAS